MNNQKNKDKLIILILLFVLSLGAYTAPSFAQYSELQTKTIQQAKKTAIFPSKYGLEPDKEEQKTEKEAVIKTAGKMVKALVLVIAIFFALIAFLIKKGSVPFNFAELIENFRLNTKISDKTKTEEKNEVKETDKPTQKPEENKKIHQTEDALQEKRVKDLVFKFFEINK